MKIFISHASANQDYGNSIVELLRGIGVHENEIIFTSNKAYGIPIAQNIFNWLKSQISEKPFVIYLLSEEYYKSVACLNEMGAAWIIESQHAAIFTPTFNLTSKEFQSGALDPREIGFYIDDEEQLLSLIQVLSNIFNISHSHIIINQEVKKFLKKVGEISVPNNSGNSIFPFVGEPKSLKETLQRENEKSKKIETQTTEDNPYSKFLDDILSNKLKEDELLLLNYMIDTSRPNLLTGWQEESEIRNIRTWEDVNGLNNKLSNAYPNLIRKFDMRRYTEASAVTSQGNPKEIKLKSNIESNLLDLPKDVKEIIKAPLQNNIFQGTEEEKEDGLPF